MDTDDRPSYEPIGPSPGASAPGEEPRIGRFGRLLKVFASPTEVFEDIRRRPTWIAALLVLLVVAVGQVMVQAHYTDALATAEQTLEMMGIDEVPREQLEARTAAQEETRHLRAAGSSVVFVLGWIVSAALFFLLLKLFGSEVGFAPVFSTTLHAAVPPVTVRAVLLSGLLVHRGQQLTSMEIGRLLKSNLAAFLDPGAPLWMVTLAGSLDLFLVWRIVLLAIGLSVVGRVSRGKGAAAAVVVWGAFIAVMTLLTALPALFMGR